MEKTRAPKCPPWCERRHRAPGPAQFFVVHEVIVAEQEMSDGGTVEVLVSWLERLDRERSTDPAVVLFTHTEELSVTTDLTAGQAGLVATLIAAAGSGMLGGAFGSALADDAGWAAEALSRAAELLGYEADEASR